jgi:hypothetical protein
VNEEPNAFQDVLAERDKLKQHCEHLESMLANISYPPGHFYSPIVDLHEPHAIEAVRKPCRRSLSCWNRDRRPTNEGNDDPAIETASPFFVSAQSASGLSLLL